MKNLQKRNRRWSDAQLADCVQSSISVNEMLPKLGLSKSGGNHRTIKQHIRRLNLDISHFLGCGHNLKKKFYGRGLPLSKILIRDSTYSNNYSLKRKLFACGLLKNECYLCNCQPVWRGAVLVLRLDHKNGIYNDNRIENLRILCPNCDSQLSTYAGRNKKYKKNL